MHQQDEGKEEEKKIIKATGRLSQLPAVIASDELIRRAKVAASRIPHDKSIYHATPRARKRSVQQADAIGQAISVPLREVLNAYDFKNLEKRLHPFEFATARLTAGHRTREGHMQIDDILNEIRSLRNGVLDATKEKAQLCKTASREAFSAQEATKIIDELLDEIEGRIKSKAHLLNELKLHGRALRRLPTVDLATPTVVLVGAPNVGKSTLVRLLSTGEPTIGNYPFTTRGVSMGHVLQNTNPRSAHFETLDDFDMLPSTSADGSYGRRHNRRRRMDIVGQVVDTPGLLARAHNESRNDMEELTLATMRYLPSAVVFVMDLSGAAGDDKSSPQDQLKVRETLRSFFPKRPWIDVISKADLLAHSNTHQDASSGAHLSNNIHKDHSTTYEHDLQFNAPADIKAPPGALFVSVKHDRGTDDLKAAVAHLHNQVAAVARAYAAAAHAPRRPSQDAATLPAIPTRRKKTDKRKEQAGKGNLYNEHKKASSPFYDT